MGRQQLNPRAAAWTPPNFAAKYPQVDAILESARNTASAARSPPGLSGQPQPPPPPARTKPAVASYTATSAARAYKRATASPSPSPSNSMIGIRKLPGAGAIPEPPPSFAQPQDRPNGPGGRGRNGIAAGGISSSIASSSTVPAPRSGVTASSRLPAAGTAGLAAWTAPLGSGGGSSRGRPARDPLDGRGRSANMPAPVRSAAHGRNGAAAQPTTVPPQPFQPSRGQPAPPLTISTSPQPRPAQAWRPQRAGTASGELQFDELFGGSSANASPAKGPPVLSSPSPPQEGSLLLASELSAPRPTSQDCGSPEATPLASADSPAAVTDHDADGGADPAPASADPEASEGSAADGVAGSPPATPPPPEGRLSPGDFEVLKVVGQGAFGKVFQVRKKNSGRIYAMKVMRKERILARDHGEYVRAERDVLTAVHHPYVVTLRYSFQTSAKLYLILDFLNGGHLFFNLYRQGIFDESQARLYTAEIVLALTHLHALNIVHRDLKPENLLLDSEGHIRLTDFGLAKEGLADGGRSNSLIGTLEYMAPEVVQGKGHDKAIDWWSVGILLYEMLCGITPFRSANKAELRRIITQQKLKFTKSADGYLSGEAKALVRALLEKDPAKRLGSGPRGSAAVKAHPFFRGINWEMLHSRKIPSPYCPEVSGDTCVTNFDKLWTDRTPEDSPCGTPVRSPLAGSGSCASDDEFKGFTYVAPSYLDHGGFAPMLRTASSGKS